MPPAHPDPAPSFHTAYFSGTTAGTFDKGATNCMMRHIVQILHSSHSDFLASAMLWFFSEAEMVSAGCAGGRGAKGHGHQRAGKRVTAEQEEATICPLTVFPWAGSPFMPAQPGPWVTAQLNRSAALPATTC